MFLLSLSKLVRLSTKLASWAQVRFNSHALRHATCVQLRFDRTSMTRLMRCHFLSSLSVVRARCCRFSAAAVGPASCLPSAAAPQHILHLLLTCSCPLFTVPLVSISLRHRPKTHILYPPALSFPSIAKFFRALGGSRAGSYPSATRCPMQYRSCGHLHHLEHPPNTSPSALRGT